MAVLALMIFGTILVRRSAVTRPANVEVCRHEPVTILKPLKGVDAGLEANLRSFFGLDYPVFELIFSVADARDPARAVVEQLMREYPHVPAQLIVGDARVGANPKINNCVRGYHRARHDVLFISDSNTRVARDHLRRTVPVLTDGVGVTTAVVAGIEPRGLGGGLEAAALNTFYARAMHLAQCIDRTCVLGKAMLLRRSNCERFGGLEMVADFLAEDFMIGETMRKLGLEVRLAPEPVAQYIGTHGIADFWSRHVRWSRIRKVHAPAMFVVEGMTSSLVSGMLGAIAAQSLWGVALLPFLVAHLGLWALCDLSLMARAEGKPPSLRMLAMWIVRELCAVPLWLHALVGNTVLWRGQRIRLCYGGVIDSGFESAAGEGVPAIG